ncbi:FAD/NAD(P)-binding domain-containing protein [Aspergillus californicus]
MPLDIIIIGGSLCGLMHAIPLHRLGHNVQILEQSPTTTPASHMAGVCLGPDMLTFLNRFDGVKDPLGIAASQGQSLDSNGHAHPFMRIKRLMTSWDALYFRLRANFDGFKSDYVPNPPESILDDGETDYEAQERAVYMIGQRVIGIKEGTDRDINRVSVTVEDVTLGETRTLSADLVLGADGPSSIVRKTFLRDPPSRRYSGYVAWRGVVPESAVSAATRKVFQANLTYFMSTGGGDHVIVYNIPGPSGSLTPGTRYLNLCWFNNVPSSSLPCIMTDTHGKLHHTSISPADLDPSIWSSQLTLAISLFPAPYREILTKIDSPFLHLITDYCSPRASFLDGRVLLLGDALALLRPHTAYSTNAAAAQAVLTERLVRGEIQVREWEYRVTTAAYMQWCRSVWFGEYFQRPGYRWVVWGYAVRYWVVAGLNWVRFLFGRVDRPVL